MADIYTRKVEAMNAIDKIIKGGIGTKEQIARQIFRETGFSKKFTIGYIEEEIDEERFTTDDVGNVRLQ